MTPEEFGARAAAAVEPVEPDTTSYAWLTRNVARRTRARRVTWAVAAATVVALAGVSLAVLPGDGTRSSGVVSSGGPSETPTTAPAPSVSTSASPSPSAEKVATATATGGADPAWMYEDPRTADVDGDGKKDVVTLVYRGSRQSPDWQWGVRVAATTAGTLTWWQDPCCSNESQELGPFADFDGDGRYELSASAGGSATARYWYLLTFAGDGLMGISTPDLVTGFEDGQEVSWGCAERGGMVRTTAKQGGTTGTRTYYVFHGGKMIQTAEANDSWGGGRQRPSEYDRAFACE